MASSSSSSASAATHLRRRKPRTTRYHMPNFRLFFARQKNRQLLRRLLRRARRRTSWRRPPQKTTLEQPFISRLYFWQGQLYRSRRQIAYRQIRIVVSPWMQPTHLSFFYFLRRALQFQFFAILHEATVKSLWVLQSGRLSFRILSLSLPTSRHPTARPWVCQIPIHTRTEHILAVICKLAQPKIENFRVPPKNTHPKKSKPGTKWQLLSKG